MKRFKSLRITVMVIIAAMLFSMILISCSRNSETTIETTETFDESAVTGVVLDQYGVANIEADGKVQLVKGHIEEREDGLVIIDDNGAEHKISIEQILPEDQKYVTGTVTDKNGKETTVYGAVIEESGGKTVVIDMETGKKVELETSKTTPTTVPTPTPKASETSRANLETTQTAKVTTATTEKASSEVTTTTVRETTVKQPAATETARPTTATTTRPTTAKPTTQEATTAAPTTTQAPTTQATTTAPTTTAATEAPTETTLPLHYNKVDTALFVQQSFAEVNKMRAEVGAAPVVMAPQIVQDYAMLRAREEGENWSWVNEIDHYRPDGEGSMSYLNRLGFDGIINFPLSENVTRNGPDSYTGTSMTRDFEWSAGHYNNIVTTKAGSVAIGYYYNEKLWRSFQIIIFLEK